MRTAIGVLAIVIGAVTLISLAIKAIKNDSLPEWHGGEEGPGDDQTDWEDLARRGDEGYYDYEEEKE